jgi:hypothetical protein
VGGTGEYAAYQDEVVDFALWYRPMVVELELAPDGSKLQKTLSRFNSLELYGDPHGLLEPLAKQLSGGVLELQVRVGPQAQREFSASYRSASGTAELHFGPSAQAFFSDDDEGYPAVFYAANGSEVVLSRNTEAAISGILETMTHH